MEVTLDDYSILLNIDDIKELTIKEVSEVSDTSDEDSGIGSYEHFGFVGVDSHPYIEVTGTLLCDIDPALCLMVSPAALAPEEPVAEEEI